METQQEKEERAAKMLTALAKVRQPFELQIDNIIEFVQHGRRKITDKDNLKGQKTGIKVYDGTAISALNLLMQKGRFQEKQRQNVTG